MKTPWAPIFALPVLVGLIFSCSTSPTGRQRVAPVPDGIMNVLGASNFEELKAKTPPVRNQAVVSYVHCVAEAITAVPNDSGIDQWEVQVFNDKQVNAFAVPGGKIGVYDGILHVANSPGQLAAILGHEVGHVIARHGSSRFSLSLIEALVTVGADKALTNKKYKNEVMLGLGLVTTFGVTLPFSRDDESEADELGLFNAAKAGFDPREAVTLWQNMGRAGGSQPPEFMSTHPSHETRIAGLQAKMDEAVAVYESAKRQGKNPNCRNPY